MVSAETARNIVGIIGNVISFGLFLAPVSTFWRIIKKKSVEEFQPFPYITTCLNCMMWILYGLPLVHPDSTLVITINGVGLLIELIYLTIFVIYAHQGNGRKLVGFGLLAEVIFVGVVAACTLSLLHTHDKRSLVVGIIADIFNICMYASPLLIWKKVVTTKSVEYMPLPLSLAGCLNGICWTSYALIKFDLFLLISNGSGAILGVMQLVLYGCYYSSTPKKSNEVVKPSEVQLSGAARV